jgi:hypothetical protein
MGNMWRGAETMVGDLIGSYAMGQDRCFTPGDTGDRGAGADAQDQQESIDRDVIADRARMARQEVERFINGNIADSTKGWPVLSRRARKKGIEPA